MSDAERVTFLYKVLESYAETLEERQACLAMISDKNYSKKELVRELSFAIVDGLKFGNWPWSKY